MDPIKAFQNQHQVGLKGLITVYPTDKLKAGAKWPLLVTIVVGMAVLLLGKDSNEKNLEDISGMAVSVLPNLLGFLLGGYTILIGFGNVDLLKSATKVYPESGISLFQTLSSIFAVTILVQSLTLILGLVAHFGLQLQVSKEGLFSWLYPLVPILDGIGFLALFFTVFYSVFALRDMVLNIFGFAQMYHQTLTLERFAAEAEARAQAKALAEKEAAAVASEEAIKSAASKARK
jgi:hypothetical protein